MKWVQNGLNLFSLILWYVYNHNWTLYKIVKNWDPCKTFKAYCTQEHTYITNIYGHSMAPKMNINLIFLCAGIHRFVFVFFILIQMPNFFKYDIKTLDFSRHFRILGIKYKWLVFKIFLIQKHWAISWTNKIFSVNIIRKMLVFYLDSDVIYCYSDCNF